MIGQSEPGVLIGADFMPKSDPNATNYLARAYPPGYSYRSIVIRIDITS